MTRASEAVPATPAERPVSRARATARAVTAVSLLLAPAACQRMPQIDGQRALARVVQQVAAGPRVPGTPGHDSVRVWIESELARLGARVEVQRFTDSTLGRPLTLSNVIGRYGSDQGRRIALLAHWDTRPWCDRDPDPARRSDPVPGANDAGSGVAVLLEVAELLSRRPPPSGVELVFLDGEDAGTDSSIGSYSRGSQEYARSLTAGAGPAVAAGFVFDMVGDRDLGIHPEVRSVRDAANLVALVLDGARARGARHFHPDAKWELYDDHVPLLNAGIPAVDIIDFDYAAWHTSRDLPDQVSAESLAEVTAVAAWLVYESPLARP